MALACLTKHAVGILFVMLILAVEVVDWLLERDKALRHVASALKLLGVSLAVSLVYFLITNHMTGGIFAARLYDDVIVRATSGRFRTPSSASPSISVGGCCCSCLRPPGWFDDATSRSIGRPVSWSCGRSC